MADDLHAILKSTFGFHAFRPGQEEAIGHLLEGRHTLVVMPTGAGKSLVYQLAALRLPGTALVISPLISLMRDQVNVLNRREIPSTFINSTVDSTRQAQRTRNMEAGKYRLVYIAPERLRSAQFREALSRTQIGLLAVDEAHCISQWGHDFRPDYLQIGPARSIMGDPVTVALTATATPDVQKDIARILGLKPCRRIVTGFNRPNLTFEVRYAADPEAKMRVVHELLSGWQHGSAIVYTGTRRDTEELSEFVTTVVGVECRHYHGGMESDARTDVQNEFMDGRLKVVAATNAFGMGIDRSDVRMVIHFAVPGTLEAYYQEAGRAGRDGKPARAVLIYSPKDRALHEFFIEQDSPGWDEVSVVYGAIFSSMSSDGWVEYDVLSLKTGLHDVKVKLALAQLEAAGIIERLGDSGNRMLLRCGEWDDKALRRIDAAALEHKGHRLEQLAKMVSYAESGECRRRILLDHFGDAAPAEAPSCCDNCLGPEVVAQIGAEFTRAHEIALIILDTIHQARWDLGRGKLAQLLNGAKTADMRQFGYDKSEPYGKLSDLSQKMIVDLIDQLISQGLVRLVGGALPVLQLTPRGQAALDRKQQIDLHIHQRPPKEPKPPKPDPVDRKSTVEITEEMHRQEMTPAEIAEARGLTVNTILGHMAELIAAGKLEASDVVPQDRECRIRAAIGFVGDVSKLTPLKMMLPEAYTYGEIRCVVEQWKREHGIVDAPKPESPKPPPDDSDESDQVDTQPDPVAEFLSKDHPRPLVGPWDVGWALGFHSRYSGDQWSRSRVGTLAHRLKYRQDRATLKSLVEMIMALMSEHRQLADVDVIVPAPPNKAREFDHVRELADALGAGLGIPVRAIVSRARETEPQKEMRSLVQKKANVAGAFGVTEDIKGKRVLLVDDFYDSGATLEEISRVLRRAGASRIAVLTLTRTIHTDA